MTEIDEVLASHMTLGECFALHRFADWVFEKFGDFRIAFEEFVKQGHSEGGSSKAPSGGRLDKPAFVRGCVVAGYQSGSSQQTAAGVPGIHTDPRGRLAVGTTTSTGSRSVFTHEHLFDVLSRPNRTTLSALTFMKLDQEMSENLRATRQQQIQAKNRRMSLGGAGLGLPLGAGGVGALLGGSSSPRAPMSRPGGGPGDHSPLNTVAETNKPHSASNSRRGSTLGPVALGSPRRGSTLGPSTPGAGSPEKSERRSNHNISISANSAGPSGRGSKQPSQQPSRQPSQQPSQQPSRQASRQPSRQASRQASRQPSRQASRQASKEQTPSKQLPSNNYASSVSRPLSRQSSRGNLHSRSPRQTTSSRGGCSPSSPSPIQARTPAPKHPSSAKRTDDHPAPDQHAAPPDLHLNFLVNQVSTKLILREEEDADRETRSARKSLEKEHAKLHKFTAEAFAEGLLKAFFFFLSFNGNSVQASAEARLKLVFGLTFLRKNWPDGLRRDAEGDIAGSAGRQSAVVGVGSSAVARQASTIANNQKIECRWLQGLLENKG